MSRSCYFALLLLTVLVTGCVTKQPVLVEQEYEPSVPPEPEWNATTCQQTNWHQLAMSQGENGHVDLKIDEIAKLCVEEGVNINTADFLRGLESQAKRYCTPHQGQQMGSQGEAYPNLCTPEIYSEFYYEWYRGVQNYCHTQAMSTQMYIPICHEIKES